MRIFVAGATGATGAIGMPLVRRLVAGGHAVAGMTRSETKATKLRELGAEPVVCDVFDAAALAAAVAAFAADAVIHQLTDLPDSARDIPSHAAANNRIRREGTRNLLAAARQGGAPRFLAQSVAWELPGDGGAAVREHERAVLDAGGVVLRYGRFYGPGTYHPDDVAEPPAVHVEEAARRTVEALDAPSGVITVVGQKLAD
jgi:nucleoside-diphosphate-sugar epimerase